MTIVNGGEVLARALKNNNVSTVFGLHGGHLDSFLFGLVDDGIELIDVRHEAAAVHAADGYARSTGRLGVSVVTSGPGVTNAVTGVAVAQVDSSPQIIIGGAPPLRDEGKYVLQGGVDQVALMAPITKRAFRVCDIDRIPEYIDQAVRIATRGRPGPVFVEVPVDVMFDRIDESKVSYFPAVSPPEPGVPAPETARRVAQLLAGAQRPVLLCGHGLIFDDAQNDVQALAETLNIPVYGNSRARGVLPHDHPLNCGNISGLAACTDTADVIVVLGARTSQMTIGRRSGGIIGPETIVVQVDSNPEEPGRNAPVDITHIGSIAQFARSVRAVATDLDVQERAAWCEQTRATYFSLDQYEAEARSHDGAGIHPYWYGRHIVDSLAVDAIVVGDGSEAYHWVEPIARTARLGRWMGHGYFGCLGIGGPFAIGAQVAHPDTQVVQVVGDGSIGFNIQEFDTMVRHHLPIITVVNSNRAWGISAHSQDALAGRRVISDLPLTAFHEVMIAFGGHGELVTDVAEIGPAFKRAVASGLPACINIVTDPTVISPRVRATNRVMDDNVGLRPEDHSAPEGTPIAVPYYEPLTR